MRPLSDVRQAILNVIEDEPTREYFKGYTDDTIDSIPYTAPEAMPERWRDFAHEMSIVFTTPMSCGTLPQDTPWGLKAIAILNGDENYAEYLN